jgi:hypothetical protein
MYAGPSAGRVQTGRFYRVQTGFALNRKQRVIQALSLMMLCLYVFPTFSAARTEPDSRPETLPFFYNPSGIFDEGQRATLERDAKLLQSSEIPTVVYVRATSPLQASPEAAQAFADAVRLDWAVETAPGKQDGLVLLHSHVPNNPRASSVVASWGKTTFEGNGLTPEYIESVLDDDVRSLLDQGHPFEALVYAMREVRYGGIYFAPAPAPLEGASNSLHTAMNWVAPIMLVAVVTSYMTLSFPITHVRAMRRSLVWKIVGATGLLTTAISILSIIGRSRIGMASALLILIALAIQVWIWTHPATRLSPGHRRRSVPPTSRRLRKFRQARHMQALAEAPR